MIARIKLQFGKWALTWIPDLIIPGHLPERIGRYRVVDNLLLWTDGGGS